MKRYRVSKNVLEQSERMAAKWEARAEAFWDKEVNGTNEGWGLSTAGFCKTTEDAEAAEKKAEFIRIALSQVGGTVYAPVAEWKVLNVLKAAAEDRDILDMSM